MAVPAKITSSIPPERMDLGEFSPITQRIASSRLLLPQPLGPTTPVSPGSIRSSLGSTKLLKPLSLSLRNSTRASPPAPTLLGPRAGALQHGFEIVPADPVHPAAVDEEGGGAGNFEFLALCVRTITDGLD